MTVLMHDDDRREAMAEMTRDAAAEISHEDRLCALESRLEKVSIERDMLARFVAQVARRVGIDTPKEL